MESNLLLEQYSWYKKQQLAKAPFECLLNADIEPIPIRSMPFARPFKH